MHHLNSPLHLTFLMYRGTIFVLSWFVIILASKLNATPLTKAATFNWNNVQSHLAQFNQHDEYIISYRYQQLALGQSETELLQQLTQAAKADIAQSIRVNVSSHLTSNTKVIDGHVKKDIQYYISSRAITEINNLNLDHFFNTKTNLGHAIAYVNKGQLQAYYAERFKFTLHQFQQCTDALNTINEQDINSDSYRQQLKKYYQCKGIQSTLHEYLNLLWAMNGTLTTQQISTLQTINKNLKKHENFALSHQGNNLEQRMVYLANAFYTQWQHLLSKQQLSITKGKLVFQNTPLISDFSDYLITAVSSELIQLGNGKIKLKANNAQTTGTITGNFWESKDSIIIKLNLTNAKGDITASVNTTIPKVWANQTNLSILPSSINKLNTLQSMQFTLMSNQQTLPMNIRAEHDNIPLKYLPVDIINRSTNLTVASLLSNNKGIIELNRNNMSSLKHHSHLKITLNANKYLDDIVESDTISQYFVIPQLNFDLKIKKPTLAFNINSKLNNTTIQQLKSRFSSSGFIISSEPNKADYLLSITINEDNFSSLSNGFHFSWHSANYEIYQSKDNQLISSEFIDSTKGGGNSLKSARQKSTHKLFNKLLSSFNNYIES